MDQNIALHKNRTILSRKNVIAGFIAAHGAMHAFMLSTPRPDGGAGNFVTHGGDVPLLNSLGLSAGGVEALGAALLLIATAGLMASALLYLRDAQTWRKALVASSIVSMIAILLFWNDWMVAAPVIDIALIVLAWRAGAGMEA
jgi:hypothetical protein